MSESAPERTEGSQAVASATEKPTVLLLDDDVNVARACERVLRGAGYDVTVEKDGRAAIEAVRARSFAVIVSDINMPNLSGIDFLRAVRAHDLDVPVILMTGNPTIKTAMEAISLGALQYLEKPVTNSELIKIVERGSKLHRLARMKRDALKILGASSTEAGDRAGLQAGFDRCLESLWMAFQPIVDASVPGLLAYEALMRSAEPSLPHPGAVLSAAERLDRLPDLGRRVRSLSAAAFSAAPEKTLLFVNLHTRDLLDPQLYASDSALARIADRVVLEITERASLDDVHDIIKKVEQLRGMGFRIAIDDLGAGYAGLSSFAALMPEFVKLDMSLVRDVHLSPIKQRLIRSIADVCKELGMRVLAEGIECAAERDAVRAMGCDLLQGYFFAKPGRPFPPVVGEF